MTHKHRKVGEAAGPQAVVSMKPDRARVVTTYVLGAEKVHPSSASLHLSVPVETLDPYVSEACSDGKAVLDSKQNDHDFSEIPPNLLKRFELFGYTLGTRDLVFLIFLVALGIGTYKIVRSVRDEFAPNFHFLSTHQSVATQDTDAGVVDAPVTFISLDQ